MSEQHDPNRSPEIRKQEDARRETNATIGMGLGVVIGVTIGLLMDNLAIGIAVGIAIGAGSGPLLGSIRKET